MRAFLVQTPGKYGLTDVPDPVIKEDEALVRVKAASICHSDFDILEGRRKHYVAFPLVPGHEFSGVIEDIGSRVANFSVGDKVACENIIWCGSCRNCNHGFTSLCLNFSEIGTMQWGAFAEYVAVPGRMLHKTERIDFNQASNVEPAGNAYHAIEAADILPGDSVVVIGPGPIGLYALQCAKLKLPGILIMLGTRDNRLAVAAELGATEVLNVHNEDAVRRIMDLTDGKGVDKVIQCATTAAAFKLALDITGINAKIIVEGFADENKEMKINFNDFLLKPMSIIGVTGVSVHHFTDTLFLMEKGLIDTKGIITHKIPLKEIEYGFKLLKARKDGAIKVVVNP